MGMLYKRGSVWWVKYYAAGRAMRETSGSTKVGAARALLKRREGDVERGLPMSPRIARVRFESDPPNCGFAIA
jgi:hypothetical protein